MKSKDRDAYYGVKPRNVEYTRETLPIVPAKKPYPGYCKRLKGEHSFELAHVKVYPRYHHEGVYPHFETFVVSLINWKEYRCSGCQKKKDERETMHLDTPIRAEAFARI